MFPADSEIRIISTELYRKAKPSQNLFQINYECWRKWKVKETGEETSDADA